MPAKAKLSSAEVIFRRAFSAGSRAVVINGEMILEI